jgi:hypothetical protein
MSSIGNNKISLFIMLMFISKLISAQELKAGFDKNEYLEILNVSAHSHADTNYTKKFDKPTKYTLKYQSPEMGLVNQWALWSNDVDRIVINIRGTTQNTVSWLANFYAAMVPAEGELHLDTNFTFKYKLAKNQDASVHIGWLVGTAYLSRDILPKIDSAYAKGVRNIIITGHSQGGGISYLLTAYLHYLQESKRLSNDITFKTYCSAAPKPGNLFFAYDYESYTQSGWAYNVVNAADWVPEVPVSIQTVNDFNKVNPFVDAKAMIKRQKFPANVALKHVYNQLDKPTKKAQRNYQKYLGKMASNIVRESLPNYNAPKYVNSNNYVRTGAYIVLQPDEMYYKKFNEKNSHVFVHHLHEPYVYLTKKLLSTDQDTVHSGSK